MIDFSIPEDVKQIRDRVAAFVDAHVLPAEAEVGSRPYFDIVAGLQAKAEARMQHLVDGPDEVHRWQIGRKVLAAQRTSGTTASAAGGDLF